MQENSKFSKLKETEREARRAILIEATLELLAKKPFDEIGVRDIAAAVGVSPASMYRYFPSREHLFVEAFIIDLQSIERWLDDLVLQTEKFSIESFAKNFISHLIESEPTFQMMSYLMIKGEMEPALLKKFNAVQRSILNKIDTVLKRAGIETDSRLFAHVFFSSLNGILMTFRNYPGRSKEEIEKHILNLSEILCKVFRYGVASTLFDRLAYKKTSPKIH